VWYVLRFVASIVCPPVVTHAINDTIAIS